VLLADGEIRVEHLPAQQRPTPAAAPLLAALSPEHAAERDRIVAALAECQGNQTQAAKKLGMSRGTLLMRIDAYRIERPRKRSP
jgi:transcriptional regulator of acetoin/glycerol metabolism